MDTLALLCNLHADGPATLQRLRRAGCESLVALRRFAPADLAARMEWNERTAERFLREAALLGERVEQTEDADANELEEGEFELESTLVEELDGDAGEAEGEPESEGDAAEGEDSEDEESGYAPPVERVAAVLGAWRELDTVAPPEEPGEYVLPRPAPAPDRRLLEAQVPGLSRSLVARLDELGVRTLQQLVGASELELARAVPLGFTRLRHLRFLAARELEHLAPAALAPAPETFEPFTPSPVEPFETAGPFA